MCRQRQFTPWSYVSHAFEVSQRTGHLIFSADLDYVCPFSAKMFKTLYTSVLPSLAQKYPSKVQFIFRQQIQPWHPSSTLVHEAGAAVLQLAPDKFWQFSSNLFDKQAEFFDVNVVNEKRNDTYGRLAAIAASVGIDEANFLDLVKVSDKPGEGGSLNVGNKVTNDLKLMVKVGQETSHEGPVLTIP